MSSQHEHSAFSDDDIDDTFSDADIDDYHLLKRGAYHKFYNDDDDDDDDEYDNYDNGGRSPTESLLIRRRNQQRLDTKRGLRPTHHRGEAYENLGTTTDPESFNPQQRIGITHATPFPSKRRSPESVAIPQYTTYLRSVSSPQPLRSPSGPLLPGGQAPSSSRVGLSKFSHYRESLIGSTSVSSRTPLHSSRDQIYSGRLSLSSPANSRRNLPQASPVSSYSHAPQPHPHERVDSPSLTQDTPDSLMQQHRALRASHTAVDDWHQLYETLEIGTIPMPEQCADAPPSQRLLAKIPNPKSSRKASILGHFYTSQSDTKFRCQVEDDSGVLCGKLFKKSGGSRGRLNHVTKAHPALCDALHEFRFNQYRVQTPSGPDELDAPSTPKRSKFETVSNMEQPQASEEEAFIDLLLELITIQGMPFNIIESDEFRALCGLLNPLYKVPSMETLQLRLDLNVMCHRETIISYIHQNVAHGSITADSWMAIDNKKFLGITYHFLTPTYKLASVVIGMEHIEGPQTSDALLKSILAALSSWGLGKKLIGGTTDQGANIKRTMTDMSANMNIAWTPCSSRKIQLCINKALDRTPPVKAVIDKCQNISTFFRNCSGAMAVLGREQERLRITNGSVLKLLTVVPTCWNSYFEMAERVLEISDAISLTYDNMPSATSAEQSKREELGRLLLSDNEVRSLREIIRLLKPAAIFMHWIGGTSNPTISQVYPRIHSMLPPLESFTTTEARELHGKLETLLKNLWSLEDIPDALLVAIYLNPACASLNMLDRVELPNKTKLRDKAKELTAKAFISFKEEERAELRRKNSAVGGLGEEDAGEEDTEEDTGEEDAEEDTEEEDAGEETGQSNQYSTRYFTLQATFVVEAYDLQVKASPKKFARFMEAPQNYWQKHQVDPDVEVLAQLARSYLSIQAISTKSERLFSNVDQVLSSQKSQLSDHNFCSIIFASNYEKVLSVLK